MTYFKVFMLSLSFPAFVIFISCGSGNFDNGDGYNTDAYGDWDGSDVFTGEDSDNDTISDTDEGRYDRDGPCDTDGDTTPDYLDEDSDGDTLPDSIEAGDMNPATPPEDADRDGDPNFRDQDSDGNGIFDLAEGASDTDGDGKQDFRDLDNDGDNISDIDEIGDVPSSPVDYDGDEIPDYLDIDSDNDTIHDRHEMNIDSDEDGNPDFHDADTDSDTIPDSEEAGDTDVNTFPFDTDEDGTPDFRDVDSDNDGLSDQWEYANGTDYRNRDSDFDGVTDLIEIGAGTDPNDPASNPRTEGNFFFIVPFMEDPDPPEDTLVFSTAIQQADVYFLVDTTGSMRGEVDTLRGSISSTVIPGMVASIPDVWVGVGHFDDYPYGGYGGSGDESYENLQNLAGDPALAQAAAAALPDGYGADGPESHVAGLFTVATGDPSRTMPLQPAPSCAAGTWGYPCFRTGSVPIIILISDADFHNGPGGAHPYSGVPAPTYAETVAALNAARIKVIAVHSDTWTTDAHFRQIALDTGAVDAGGNPLVYNIPGSGEGLGEQVINAVATLANQIPISVTTQPRDDTSDAVDATIFIDYIEPNTVDSVEDPEHPGVFCVTGLLTADTDGDTIQDTYTSVLPGTAVCFDIYPAMNETVEATPEPQVYMAFVDVIGDGITVLDTREVYFLIPPVIEGPGGPD